MLFLHETHAVKGKREDDFEDAFRSGWMPMLARGDDARLLYFAHHAHGTGLSYRVVTITAIADGAAWERLAVRIQQGELQEWMRDLDELRHDVEGKLLVPVHWSPLQTVDLATVPIDGREHENSLFMEDTGWPDSSLDAYIQCWHDIYYVPMSQHDPATQLLDIQACFQVAHGTHRRREAILWQKIVSPANFLGLLSHDTPPEHRAPGTYMHDALEFRDQWQSRILRTVPWSPLY